MGSGKKFKAENVAEERNFEWWLAVTIIPVLLVLGITGVIIQAHKYPTSEKHAAQTQRIQQVQKTNIRFLTAHCNQNEDRATHIAEQMTHQLSRQFNPNSPVRNIPIEFDGLQTTSTIQHDYAGKITKIEETGTHYLICKA